MTLLSWDSSDPILFWAVNILVQVAMISIVALLVAIFLRRHSAIRYRLLFSAMLLVLLCPFIAGFVQAKGAPFGFPTIRLSQLRMPSLPAWQKVPVAKKSVVEVAKPKSLSTSGELVEAEAVKAPGDTTSKPIAARPESVPRNSKTSALSKPRAALRALVILFAVTWVIGSLYLLIRLLVSFRRLQRLLGDAERNENEEVAMAYRQLWRSIAGDSLRKPELLLSDAIDGPIAAGWRHPKVVLPSTLPRRISREQLRNVLMHELAHIQRGDQIVVLLQNVVAAIFWIHPCVRVLNRKLAQAREEICDNFVLQRSGPTEYSRTLLDLAGMMSEPIGVPCTVGLFVSRWKLEHRIAGLLDSRRNRETRSSTVGRGAIAIVTLALLSAVSLSTLAPAQEAAKSMMRFLNAKDPSKDAIGDDLPPNAVMRFGTRRFQPSSGTEMVLSPDDSTVISLNSGNIVASDARNGKQLWSHKWSDKFGEHIMGVAYGQHFIDFGKDSSTFVTTGRGNQVHIWNTRKGTVETVELQIPANPVLKLRPQIDGNANTSIDVTSDGKRFAVGGKRGIGVFEKNGERVWYLSNVPAKPIEIGGADRDRLNFGGDYATAIFSPDEKTLAAVLSQDPKTIKLINPRTDVDIDEITTPAKPVRLTFSPDGKSLYTTQRDCSVRSYSTKSRKLEWEFVVPKDENGAESYASAIDCSSDGKLLAVGMPIGPKYWIYLVDAKTGKEVSILKSDMWKPWAVQFTKDNKTLYSNGWDGIVRRWDVATAKELPLPEGIRASDTITISPDGKRVAFTDGSGDVRIVDSTSGIEKTRITPENSTGEVLLFSPDSLTIHIGGSRDDNVSVESRSLADGKTVNTWQWPRGKDSHSSVEELATTKGGKYLAAAVFRQDAAYIWDTTSAKKVATLKHQEVYGLDFSPDGEVIATVGWDKAIRIWETASGKLKHEISVAEHFEDPPAGGDIFGAGNVDVRMYGVRFSPDGKQLAVAHMGGLTAWDVSDFKNPERLFFSQGAFTYGALDYSSDGEMIAAGGAWGQVALYDSQTGAAKLKVGKHTDHVYTVRFGGDGSRLVSGGGGVSYLWDASKN